MCPTLKTNITLMPKEVLGSKNPREGLRGGGWGGWVRIKGDFSEEALFKQVLTGRC